MLRRNFFATLLAPLVARFAPKPSPVEGLCAALRALPPFWEFYTLEHRLKILGPEGITEGDFA